MKFYVMTLFPEMIENGLNTSILGKAAEKGIISFEAVNMRDYTQDKHGKVDDYPYGGGAGMLIQAQPVFDAYKSITKEMQKNPRTIYLTPQGQTFDQKMARELACEDELVFVCGHYEGIDERVLDEIVTDYVSIGDYVLTGGELPVMVMIDAISRMVPGVLNNDMSAETETFHNDLLEYPQYTRPEVWHEKEVPKVLLSGNHKNIVAWRLEQSIAKTKERRPDLYQIYCKKQEIIHRLSKKKRRYIHMMEFLNRGLGEVFYEKDMNILLGSKDFLMISATSEDDAERMLRGWLKRKELTAISCGKTQKAKVTYDVSVTEEFVKDILMQKFGLQVSMKCYQACYTNKVPLPVRHKDIRLLGKEHLEFITQNYDCMPVKYIRERLEACAFWGAYDADKLIGFVGIHAEGSMGMLFVEQEYRRKGIGEALESYIINLQIANGQTPYCQIVEGNDASMALQEKLGLYFAQQPMWWLYKE